MLTVSALAVRPLGTRFVAIGASVFALLAAVTSGLWEAGTTGEIWSRTVVWLALDLCASSGFALSVAALHGLVPERLFVGPPRIRGLVLFYGGYALAGLVGGLARRWAGSYPALRPEGPWPWNYYADVGSVVFAGVVLGVAANQYAAFLERFGLQEQALRAQVAELQRSRRQITIAEERVRREIAELLHGRVQTRLLVAWHRLGECERQLTADPDRARTVLTGVRELIDQIRDQEVRQASHLLHPSIIRIGLVPAIRSLLAHAVPDIEVALEVDPGLAALDDPGQNRIPESVRLVAYRVVEEALNNIYRHAGASRVAVSLCLDAEGRLDVTVRDDGRGFATDHLQPGLGLGSIEAWVGRVGGLGELTSARGQGTALRVRLPVAEEAADQDRSSPQEAGRPTRPAASLVVWPAPGNTGAEG